MTLTPVSDDTKKQLAKLLWHRNTVRCLYEKGFTKVAYEFRNCGCTVRVKVCKSHLDHEPKAFPLHCGNRFCEECERRESYRKLSSYLPALQSLLTPNPDHPEHFLFKLVLTSPYGLSSLDAASFKEKQKSVKRFLETYFYRYYEKRGELTQSEIRRGRCDLKRHGIGGLRSAEFGETNKHLHWHILIYAPYMPHSEILTVWRDVTGDVCKFARVNGIYAKGDGKLNDGGDILGAVKEIVKYTTKFTVLKPSDVPHLHEVLKGNRRFEAFGILYGIERPDSEETSSTCEECGAEHEILTIGEYINRCEIRHIAPSDDIADAVENGIALFLSREPEISSGKSSASPHKPRDSIDSET